jgi:hypothetical protein
MNYILYSAENVLLTHVIKCRIDVEEFHAALDMPTCKLCANEAQWYCENDQEYFCQSCDELAHEADDNDNVNDSPDYKKTKLLNLLRVQHKRVAIQDAKPH